MKVFEGRKDQCDAKRAVRGACVHVCACVFELCKEKCGAGRRKHVYVCLKGALRRGVLCRTFGVCMYVSVFQGCKDKCNMRFWCQEFAPLWGEIC